MVNFGYSINKDNQINYDKNNHKLSEYLLKKEPSLNICISCGSCTATCSAGIYTDLNLRKLIILIKRGEISKVEKEIEKCQFCGKCRLVCPRGVNTRNLILKIKEGLLNNNINK